ncbi:nitrate- and nitrite sensing domain-containing protein [Streptomyces sp. NPDC048603]|uniref:sensor histidine kinase n=1 Tax=Streptomyces sp. NPDC048603 TaxID=3365577 RepID=UPI00371CE79A
MTTVVTPRTIRAKLVRILVVAVALLLTLLGFSAAQQAGDYRNAASTASNAELAIRVQDFIHELQRERGLTVGHVAGIDRFRAMLPAQRAATDAARRSLAAHEHDGDSDSAAAVRTALKRLDGLAAMRASADRDTVDVNRTIGYFTDVIASLNQLGLGLHEVRDNELRSAFQALQILGLAKEYTSEERAIVLGSVRAGRFRGDAYPRFLAARAARLDELLVYPQWATPEEERRLDEAMHTPQALRFLALEKTVADGVGQLPAEKITPTAWWDTSTATIDGMRTVQRTLGADIQARADSAEQEATRALALFALLALGSILLLGGLAVSCTRAVSRPLAGLTRQARDIAENRLPAAVARVQASSGRRPEPLAPLDLPPNTGTEIALVAEAFEQLQQAAYDLATEQAVLRRNATESLVNLGRRNQNLVRRQISFINKLEHEDADPATLGNLFELDQLATRMRRNAESLLILAGEASPRPWSTPVSVTDVIRAALSEVEEYRRVTLRRVDAAHISGSVVAEVAHLLAELVENALSYSPPVTDVEIEGRRTSAGYLVAIVDHGTGMEPRAIAEANVRLSGSATFMAEPTRFLGHFVVGALARKCGIEVRLGEAPAAGTVARVLLPHGLLKDPAPAAAPQPDPEEKGNGTRNGNGTGNGTGNGNGKRKEEADATVSDKPTRAVPLPSPRSAPDAAPAAAPAAGRPVAGTSEDTPAAPAPAGSATAPVRDVPAAGDPTSSPTPSPASDPAPRGTRAARTRNGLVKRPKRSAIPSAVSETAQPRWQQESEPTPDRTPDQVSGMLSTLRSAHMRGAISVEKEKQTARKPEQRAGKGDEK